MVEKILYQTVFFLDKFLIAFIVCVQSLCCLHLYIYFYLKSLSVYPKSKMEIIEVHCL